MVNALCYVTFAGALHETDHVRVVLLSLLSLLSPNTSKRRSDRLAVRVPIRLLLRIAVVSSQLCVTPTMLLAPRVLRSNSLYRGASLDDETTFMILIMAVHKFGMLSL